MVESVFNIHQIINCPTFQESLKYKGILFTQDPNVISQNILADARQSPDKREFVQTLGFVGSGKTIVIKAFCLANPGYAVLAWDDIMSSFDGYHRDYKSEGPEEAFKKWELPARALGYEILQEGIRRKLNIALEHSGAREDHLSLAKTLSHDHGYTIRILDTNCPPELAMERAKKRPCARWFPPDYVHGRKQMVDRLKPEYRQIANAWMDFDTSGPAPRLRNKLPLPTAATRTLEFVVCVGNRLPKPGPTP